MLTPDNLLHEWFGRLDEHGGAAQQKVQRWFKKDPKFDEHLRRLYASLAEQARKGGLSWDRTATDTVAEIVLLDQFCRNMFRDTPAMFAGDLRARALATKLIDSGAHARLPAAYRIFVYMPLMHSEELSDQERCIQCFEELLQEAHDSLKGMLKMNLDFARAHRDIIAKFGRFPHRNTIMGRQTTAEEAAFLKQPGSSF